MHFWKNNTKNSGYFLTANLKKNNLNRQMYNIIQKPFPPFLLLSYLILKTLILLNSIQISKINHSHADYF